MLIVGSWPGVFTETPLRGSVRMQVREEVRKSPPIGLPRGVVLAVEVKRVLSLIDYALGCEVVEAAGVDG